jgi:uncharacterized protein (DUF1778 family)
MQEIVVTQNLTENTENERLTLSERDSLRVLDLLENPRPATERLVQAAKNAAKRRL